MFSLNSRFYKIMTKAFDFIGLNIIFILLCIPVITIGANITALYSVTMKIANKEDVYPFKLYFQTFFKNFKQATFIWLILIILGGILYINYQLTLELNTFRAFMIPMIYFFSVLGTLFTLFVFPVLAKFHNSVIGTLKSTFLILIGFLPYTLLIISIIVGPTLAMIYWYPTLTPYLLTFYLVMGISYTFYITSFLYNRIFKKVIENTSQSSFI